jgi:hypothetical protein
VANPWRAGHTTAADSDRRVSGLEVASMSVACILIDGDERVEVEYGTDLWHASMEWARFHGLDPNRIPAGSEVIRDAVRRRIVFEEYVFDGDDLRLVDNDPVIVPRVEQGEAPPLPLPKVAP